MVLNQEKNLFSKIDCFFEEHPNTKRKDLVDCDGSRSDKCCADIADLLPDDPFGMEDSIGLPSDPFRMDFNLEATVEVITDWTEEFGYETDEASEDEKIDDSKLYAEMNFVLTSSMVFDQEEVENEAVDFGSALKSEDGLEDFFSEFETDEASEDEKAGDSKLYAEVNFVWTSSMEFDQEKVENVAVDPGSALKSKDGVEDFGFETCELETDEASEDEKADDSKLYAEVSFVWTSSMEFNQEGVENEAVDPGSALKYEDGVDNHRHMLDGSLEKLMCFGCEKCENEDVKDYSNVERGAPADALYFALGYLGVKDLLSVENVCKSLCDAVRNDPLLWRNIHIEYPMNLKIIDDNLLQLTNRAQGTLHSLSLVQCLKITNNGLKQVLKSNLGLTKLGVPGCIKISVEDILNDLEVFKSIGKLGIKHLRISELHGATSQLYEEFKRLLGIDEKNKSSNDKPIFYHAWPFYFSLDDERAIDIETCPRCQEVRQVFDCPRESCQVKPPSVQTCRACISCIARCVTCGDCLDNKDYVETFFLDRHCLECSPQQLFNCQDRSPRNTHLHQKTSYHFFLRG